MDICLRPTNEADLNFVLTAEQDEDNRAFVNQWERQQHQEALFDQNIAHLIIESHTNSKPVGYVILVGLENADLSINIKRLVVTDKSKGYGKQALRLIKKLAFEELPAHRLWLDVKVFNPRAKYVYESEGFIVEGVLRECIKTGNKFESLVVMSMLRDEYYTQSRGQVAQSSF